MIANIGASTYGAGRRAMAARRAASLFPILLVFAGACAGAAKQPVLPTEAAAPAPSNEAFNQQIALMATQSDPSDDYRIGPEDLLEVTLFDLQDEMGEPRVISARVSNTGVVTLPYVGMLPAAERTPLELETELREAYRQYIHEPQLSVFIKEYRSYRVSVIGYVKTPGVLELKGRKTLLESLAMVGGLTDDAGTEVRVTRATPEGTQTMLVDLDRIASEGDISLNVDLLPGDVVTVPKAGTFYVEGIVRKPGAYPLLQQTTVSQAIATAGGADESLAKLSGTTLYRKGPDGERVAMEVDLAALSAGQGEDFLLQEDDVIVVPMSNARLWVDRVTRGVLHVGFTAPLM